MARIGETLGIFIEEIIIHGRLMVFGRGLLEDGKV
tara:strand:- start:2897 stop:3001 length:105 start_codon:yes stop_codon:yes gene_type:complete